MTAFTTTTRNYPINIDTAIRRVVANRDPQFRDYRNFIRGDLWLNQVNGSWWILVTPGNAHAIWIRIGGGGAGTVISLTGNLGGPVPADGAGNINVVGTGNVLVTGNPLTNTLTISNPLAGTVSFLKGNVGGNVPPDGGGVINVVGTGAINVVGNPGTNTLTISTTSVGTVGFLEGDVGGPVGPDGAGIIHTVGSGPISVVGNPGTNTLTWNDGGEIASTYVENIGSATPAANILNIVGTATNGIQTTGAGNTVTVSMHTPFANSDFEFRGTIAGTKRVLQATHTDTTVVNSDAEIQALVATGSKSAPYYNVAINGTRSYGFGLDPTNSNAFTLRTSPSSFASSYNGVEIIISNTLGYINYPQQPAFNVTLTLAQSNLTNVTGDGTFFIIPFERVLLNASGSYSTITHAFTAPVTGNYFFQGHIMFEGMNAAHIEGNALLWINGGATRYDDDINPWFIRNDQNEATAQICVLHPLTAGDTVQLVGRVSLGTKTVNIQNNQFAPPNDFRTWFSGWLVT